MASVMPKGLDWIKDYVTGFKPESNLVSTIEIGDVFYDYLLVALGLIMDTSLIEGLTESLGKGVVCSNYDPKHLGSFKNFKGGNAVFTQPNTPLICGGAPQKIAF